MKSEQFINRYYYALVYSGRKDMISVPGMDMHKWWGKVNKFWRYFTTEQWLKCKTKTELRARTRPEQNMPVISVDPILRWVFVSPDVFFKQLDDDDRDFLIFVSCCILVAYNADNDELNVNQVARFIKTYPEWERHLDSLSELGQHLPLGLTRKAIINETCKTQRSGCMFSKNTRKVKSKIEMRARESAAALLFFEELNELKFKDSETQCARDRAIESYVQTMEYMEGDDGVIHIADKIGVRPDYFPWTVGETVTYTFGFELVAGDTVIGTISRLFVESKSETLTVETDQFQLRVPVPGIRKQIEDLYVPICDRPYMEE